MNQLLAQIAKFGVVGVICFVIDYVLYLIANSLFQAIGLAEVFPSYYLISGCIGFSVSVVANYLLSMKYVFARREDMSRQREFAVFLILSIIGLGINELCLFIGIDVIYNNWRWLQGMMGRAFAENLFFKCGATGVVMVYNFISRKLFLEKRQARPQQSGAE